MRFGVVGADKESGNDVEVVLTAASQAEAEAEACKRGILVSGIKIVAEPEGDAIALVDDEPPAPSGTGTVAGASVAGPNGSGHSVAGGSVAGAAAGADHANNKTSHGLITVNASAPSDTAHTGAGTIATGPLGPTAMEYHVIMNQSLYLLETAVNKHLRDGWEPSGGLGIGMSNNAQQFYQAILRRKK